MSNDNSAATKAAQEAAEAAKYEAQQAAATEAVSGLSAAEARSAETGKYSSNGSSTKEYAYSQDAKNKEILQQLAKGTDTYDKTTMEISDYTYGRSTTRRPWTLTTVEMEANSEKPLEFYINPGSYTLENPLRQQIVQAKGGPVIHTFRDSRRGNTNLGFSTMRVSMQSGSIMPVPRFGGTKANTNVQYVTIPKGLDIFYKWLNIIQQDTLWYNPITESTEENYQILTINTLIFPFLRLYGFFTENANFGENSDNPTEIQSWEGNFLIYKSTPALTLDQVSDLAGHWNLQISSGNSLRSL